jgi:hypothetical protein
MNPHHLFSRVLEATFSNRGSVARVISANALVVANGSSDPFGYGWGLVGLDQLVAVSGGMMWVTGNGGVRFFSGSGGTYTSPANDFGTLGKNGDNTYTRTSGGPSPRQAGRRYSATASPTCGTPPSPRSSASGRR